MIAERLLWQRALHKADISELYVEDVQLISKDRKTRYTISLKIV